MLTFIAFILTMFGSINWLLIGLLQYDFIAGLFGFQASMFSRVFYILFGIGAVYFAIRILVNKGSVKIFERKQKKSEVGQPAIVNAEASKEQTPQHKNDFQNQPANRNFYHDVYEESLQDNLFDEHLKNK